MANNLNQIEKLDQLYKSIHSCTLCHNSSKCNIKYDPDKTKRSILKKSLNSEIIIVGQSLAANQVRLSGIPYHDINGKLGCSGRYLEKYLNSVKYTLDPHSSKYNVVYTTDLIQCFPGKKTSGQGDNKPTNQEILNFDTPTLLRGWILTSLKKLKPTLLQVLTQRFLLRKL